MEKKYLFGFFLVIFLLVAPQGFAQETPEELEVRKETPIEGLSIYPNPTTGNRVFVVTDKKLQKQIEIYNVLGKPVLSVRISGNQLNISTLESGIYIIKIREGNSTATRKLVVR